MSSSSFVYKSNLILILVRVNLHAMYTNNCEWVTANKYIYETVTSYIWNKNIWVNNSHGFNKNIWAKATVYMNLYVSYIKKLYMIPYYNHLDLPVPYKKLWSSIGVRKWQGFKPTIEPSFFAPHFEQVLGQTRNLVLLNTVGCINLGVFRCSNES
jgi:hypothetical protein